MLPGLLPLLLFLASGDFTDVTLASGDPQQQCHSSYWLLGHCRIKDSLVKKVLGFHSVT